VADLTDRLGCSAVRHARSSADHADVFGVSPRDFPVRAFTADESVHERMGGNRERLGGGRLDGEPFVVLCDPKDGSRSSQEKGTSPKLFDSGVGHGHAIQVVLRRA
jgi:hypothetical protein